MTTAPLLVIDLKMVQITSVITTDGQEFNTQIRLSMIEINCIGQDILALKTLGMLGLMPIGMSSKELRILTSLLQFFSTLMALISMILSKVELELATFLLLCQP
jgi:hypothetical protein